MTVEFLFVNALLKALWIPFWGLLLYFVLRRFKVNVGPIYFQTIAALFLLSLLVSFNSGKSGAKFKLTDESEHTQEDYGATIKDNSPVELSDSERLDFNQKLYESNRTP